MFDEPRLRETGPLRCEHCGTRLAAPLIFCPECGANQLAAPSAMRGGVSAPERPERPERPPSGFADRLREYCGAMPANIGGAKPAGGGPVGGSYYRSAFEYQAIDEEHEVRRSRRPLYAWAVVGLAFAAAAYAMILPRSEWEPIPGVQVIEGSVGGKHDMQSDPDGEPSASGDAPAAIADAAPPANADDDSDAAAVPSRHASTPNGDATARVDVSRQLAIARTDLNRNSLWPARKAIANALARQPGNDEALRMRAELASRERERDSLLAYARQCSRSGQSACLRQYAGRAASVDTSSREAKRLLARAGNQRETWSVARAGGNRSQTQSVAQTGDPDLMYRLRRWFERSVTQAQMKPQRQMSSWDRP